MAGKRIELEGVLKFLFDAAMMLVFGTPAMVASYIWQTMSVGWAFGKWAFDPELFHRRYVGDASKAARNSTNCKGN